MGMTLTLGRLFDIRVGVHASWFAVYVFMTVSLASTMVTVPHPFALAIAAIWALALFASVVIHEFAHALVARRFGVQTSAITLFLFGGVATLERDPPSPGAEIAIALAGPVASAVVAVVTWLVMAFAQHAMSETLDNVFAYLAVANAVLAIFNLVPAYPMDGGRVLRATLWAARHRKAEATAVASFVGLLFAVALIALGIGLLLRERAWQDTWYVVLGGFLLRQGWEQFGDAREASRAEAAAT